MNIKHFKGLELMGISFLALFLELALIRYVNSTVQIILYFNNILVVSSFFGLGLGSCLTRFKVPWFNYFPVALLAYLLVMAWFSHYGFVSAPYDMMTWSFSKGEAMFPFNSLYAILIVFSCNVSIFIPIGFRLGQVLDQFDNRVNAYTFDLLGSILGIIAFAFASWLRTPPWFWLGIVSLISLFLLHRMGRAKPILLLDAAVLIVATLTTLIPLQGKWSPYYKITEFPYQLEQNGVTRNFGSAIMVDKLRIQDALDFDSLHNSPLEGWYEYYEMPYQLSHPKHVLILAGGSGNDTAEALRLVPDAKIDVVEIDPVLLQNGFDYHPQRPYLDPRVRTFNDDARAFLRNSTELYDLIVMNALDSHRETPGTSTVRLESFIYTVEAFNEVKKHLAPGGTFFIHLTSSRAWMTDRIFWTLTESFGRQPRMYDCQFPESVGYYLGPEPVKTDYLKNPFKPLVEINPFTDKTYKVGSEETLIATDDWPQLYLEKRTIPDTYLSVLITVLGFAFLIRQFILKDLGSERSDQHFLLLGAGFMLLETRSITNTALLFGSTWFVNATVIGSVLTMVFLSNLSYPYYSSRFPKWLSYVGLFTCLILNYSIPLSFLLSFPFTLRIVASGLWLGSSVFFAGLIFSASFSRTKSPSSSFGSNLFGVVLGGTLEYLSMIFGLNSLYLIAMTAYAGAFLTDERRTRLPSP